MLSGIFAASEERISEEYSEPCQWSKIQLYAKIVNGSKSLTIFAKNFVLDDRIFLFPVNNIFIFFSVEHKISVKARSIMKTS